MMRTFFQVVHGIWNPAGQAHTMILFDEFDSYKEAKREAVALAANLPSAPVAIIEIKTKVLWRSHESTTSNVEG